MERCILQFGSQLACLEAEVKEHVTDEREEHEEEYFTA